MGFTLLEVVQQLPKAAQDMEIDKAVIILKPSARPDASMLLYQTETNEAITLMARLIEHELDGKFTSIPVVPDGEAH